MTQPVPPHGSSVRLNLPVPVDKIVFSELGGIGGFGVHQGGHCEGLDHIWLHVEEGIPIGSWADGEVMDVRPSGDIELGELAITIRYDDGLWGYHGEVATALVEQYDRVVEGQPVAYGMSWSPGTQSAEMSLWDANRADGISAFQGVSVSPFDYLREDVKEQLIERYTREVVEPYLSRGIPWASQKPWEPYLTNPLLIHRDHPGTIAGEWLLNQEWGADGRPDVLTLLDVDNEYYQGRRVMATDGGSQVGRALWGTWEADYVLDRVKILSEGPTYYGIFELDESGPRATLKLEYQEGSYPSGFSENASMYIERDSVPRVEDAAQLGVLQNQ